MKKELFDLKAEDLLEHHLWRFPMNEDESETQIEAVDTLKPDKDQIIVATKFDAKNGRQFIGYIYLDINNEVNRIKPVVIFGDENLNIWTGIRKPTNEKILRLRFVFGSELFPMKYEAISQNEGHFYGVLEGVYFLNENGIIDFLTF